MICYMPGRIGKTYPRMTMPQPASAAPTRSRVPYGLIGALIGFLSALVAAGWLIFR